MKQPKKKTIASKLFNLAKEYFGFKFFGSLNNIATEFTEKIFLSSLSF